MRDLLEWDVRLAEGGLFGSFGNVFRLRVLAEEADGCLDSGRELERRPFGFPHPYSGRAIFFERFVWAGGNSGILWFFMALRDELCDPYDVVVVAAGSTELRRDEDEAREVGHEVSAFEDRATEWCDYSIWIDGNDYEDEVNRIVNECVCDLGEDGEAFYNENGPFLRDARVYARDELVSCDKKRAARGHQCFEADLSGTRSVVGGRRCILLIRVARVLDRYRTEWAGPRSYSK